MTEGANEEFNVLETEGRGVAIIGGMDVLARAE
jgi:hypothetical protein